MALRQLDSVLSAIRSVKRKFPKLVEEFSQQLHAAIDDAPPEQEPEAAPIRESEVGEQEYGVEKMIAWFQSRNNEPATIPEMANAIGRSAVTIKSIIYTRHKGTFVAIAERGRNNRARYRLANA